MTRRTTAHKGATRIISRTDNGLKMATTLRIFDDGPAMTFPDGRRWLFPALSHEDLHGVSTTLLELLLACATEAEYSLMRYERMADADFLIEMQKLVSEELKRRDTERTIEDIDAGELRERESWRGIVGRWSAFKPAEDR